MLLVEYEAAGLFARQMPRRELAQRRFTHREHQARITADDRVAHLVALPGIEEEDVVRVGHGLLPADVPQIDAAIWEHEVRVRRAFFGAAMPARTAAIHVAYRHRARVEQAIHREILRRIGHAGTLPAARRTRHRVRLNP